jgi:DNA processing protein
MEPESTAAGYPDSNRATTDRDDTDRAAALALASFLADYNWPLRVPTGKMTPRQLWNCADDLLAGLLKLPRHAIPRLSAFRKTFSAAGKFEELRKKNVSMITLGEKNYPVSLAQIHDPPPALFLRGGPVYARKYERSTSDVNAIRRLLNFMERPRIAIVGARAASPYGLDATTEIARGLARRGVCVVSGMALGIDAAAHRGSVAEAGGSIAVLGCGADVIYPAANRYLYAELVEHGLVISEYPPGTRPLPWRFPARNRIMAGLGDGVIVVEARDRSGALITADFCLEEGRDVFAVPGSIFSELSRGPHQLIGNGAGMVTSAEDVLESLGIEVAGQHLFTDDTSPPADLNDAEKQLFLALEPRPCHLDALAARAGLDGAQAAAALVQLELRGHARLEPGRGYSR